MVYLVQWRLAGPAGLPLARHPAALLLRAFPALWRNRGMIALFLALAALSAAVQGHFLAASYLPGPQQQRLSLSLAQTFVARLFGLGWIAALLPSLPSWVHGFHAGNYLEPLVLLALAMALGVAAFRPPVWLDPGPRWRPLLAALFLLLASVSSVFAAYLVLVLSGLRPDLLAADGDRVARLLPFSSLSTLGLLLAAPWSAFAYSLVWQMAQGRRCRLRVALQDTIRLWPAVLCLEVTALPAILGSFGFDLAKGFFLSSHHVSAFSTATTVTRAVSGWGNMLFTLLASAVFLLPWIILGEGLGFVAALREHFRLWRKRGRDLGVFVVRYFTLMLVPGILLAPLEYFCRPRPLPAALLALGSGVWSLARAVTLAQAYLEFRQLEPSEAREATPAPPSVLPADA